MEGPNTSTTPAPLTPTPNAVEVGQQFNSREDARVAAERELAATGRTLKNGKGAGSRQLHVVCKTCSTWFVKGCAQKTGIFKITQAPKGHTNCVGGGGRPSSKCLEPLVQQLVRGDPTMKGTAVKRSLKQSGMDASARTSQRMKKRVKNEAKAKEADAIARVPSFCEAIERDCPGSVATVEETADGHFVRSFLMLGKSAHVAANSVAKVAAMDAGHLKGPWKGVMYILTMRDSNNRLIHVSTVIADKENETNYRFLLQQTCKNEELGPLLASGEVTFFIDGHRGSPPALRRVVPLAPVRTCLRHLITNKAMKAMGAGFSAAVYKAAKMPSAQLFEEAMAPIKERFPGNHAFLMKTPLEKWTHHATDRHLVVQDTTTSNNAESTIAMVGAEARALNPFHLMMSIAERSAEHLATNAELKKDSADELVPFANKFVENESKLSLSKVVKPFGLGIFLVQEHATSIYGNRVSIQLPDANGQGGSIKCTCCVPSRWKLPCCDVLAALRYMNRLDATMMFVDSGYKLAFYRGIHSDPDFPVVLPIWTELSKGSLLPPRPVDGQAGAPKKGPSPRARIRGANDNCQRGRSKLPGGAGAGAGAGTAADSAGGRNTAPPVHGMSSVRSFVGDVGVGGRADAVRPAARSWGPLAVSQYGSQGSTTSISHGDGTGGGSSTPQNLSQGSIDLSQGP